MSEANRGRGHQPRPKGDKARPEREVSHDKVAEIHKWLEKEYFYFSQALEFTWNDLVDVVQKLAGERSESILNEEAIQPLKRRKWQFWPNDDNTPCFQVSTKKGLDEKDLRQLVGEFRSYIHNHGQKTPHRVDENDGWQQNDIVTLTDSLENEDMRELALSSIRLRRGQSRFRRDLIRSYGAKCLLTGCEVVAVLEAAHIKPYRGRKDNKLGNGLLLRADIHTLFDLNLLGIHPETLEVSIHPDLDDGTYTQYRGRRLEIPGVRTLIKSALIERWSEFLNEKNKVNKAVKGRR